jgi:hypothetical protein
MPHDALSVWSSIKIAPVESANHVIARSGHAVAMTNANGALIHRLKQKKHWNP